MCPHTTICVSSCYYTCVLILQYLYVSTYYYTCVTCVLLYLSSYCHMCPHTTACVPILLHVWPGTTTTKYILVLLYMCPHDGPLQACILKGVSLWGGGGGCHARGGAPAVKKRLACLYVEGVCHDPFCSLRYACIRQHASAYVSIRQHTSWGRLPRRILFSPLRLHTSAYVSIRQHTSAYVSKRREGVCHDPFCSLRYACIEL
jgi:hypothetical protein